MQVSVGVSGVGVGVGVGVGCVRVRGGCGVCEGWRREGMRQRVLVGCAGGRGGGGVRGRARRFRDDFQTDKALAAWNSPGHILKAPFKERPNEKNTSFVEIGNRTILPISV